MPEITIIHVALPSEHRILEDIKHRAAMAWESDRDYLEAHPEAMSISLRQIEDGHIHVAERQGKQVGFYVVIPRNDGDIHLDGVYVDTDAWKLGIGRLLVSHAGIYARTCRAHALYVTSTPNSVGFYEACGFQNTGQEKTVFGFGFTMRKNLAS